MLNRLTRQVAKAAAAAVMITGLSFVAVGAPAPTNRAPTVYKSVDIDGVKLFYREAGPASAPTILLLHGLPSSSREFDALLPLLADRYHLVAPDYPGFGHSDSPPPEKFKYTFENISNVIDKFTQTLGLKKICALRQRLWRTNRLSPGACSP